MFLRNFVCCFLSVVSLKIPSAKIGSFASRQAENFKLDPIDKIYISDDLNVDPPPYQFDMMVYNTSDIARLTAMSFDKLLIETQRQLNTLGMIILDVPNTERIFKSLSYRYILDNPTELWNYNLVSVDIDGNKISARKGSSLVFKERMLLKFAEAEAVTEAQNSEEELENDNPFAKMGFIVIRSGNEQLDWIINLAGIFLQYTILFNFFSFGIMMLMHLKQ